MNEYFIKITPYPHNVAAWIKNDEDYQSPLDHATLLSNIDLLLSTPSTRKNNFILRYFKNTDELAWMK